MSGGDVWEVGDAYEAYVGRWSRRVAREFVSGLGRADDLRWLDVGCGTGALSAAITGAAAVVGVDRSAGFLRGRRAVVNGDGGALPVRSASFDVVVSGLALNFMPDPRAAVAEMARAAREGGLVATYVWDYGNGMQMMRQFWDVAAEVDPAQAGEDEVRRFPMCRPEPLRDLWIGAGLRDVATGVIEVPTVFADFDDYWTPFLGGQGAAPAYVARMDGPTREAVRQRLHERLGDGPIELTAAAWTVRGVRS
jgi:SAM-dependent methyltransferase